MTSDERGVRTTRTFDKLLLPDVQSTRSFIREGSQIMDGTILDMIEVYMDLEPS